MDLQTYWMLIAEPHQEEVHYLKALVPPKSIDLLDEEASDYESPRKRKPSTKRGKFAKPRTYE